jgi:hypothetical protein
VIFSPVSFANVYLIDDHLKSNDIADILENYLKLELTAKAFQARKP